MSTITPPVHPGNIHNFSTILGRCVLPPVQKDELNISERKAITILKNFKEVIIGHITPGRDISGDYFESESAITKEKMRWQARTNAKSRLEIIYEMGN